MIKMKELKKRKVSNILKVVGGTILCFLLIGFILNPLWTIIILLLLIAAGLFIYSILFEKKIISFNLKLSQKLIHIICGICLILAFTLFIVNIVTHPKNLSSENKEQKEVEKNVYYETAEEFEKPLKIPLDHGKFNIMFYL